MHNNNADAHEHAFVKAYFHWRKLTESLSALSAFHLQDIQIQHEFFNIMFKFLFLVIIIHNNWKPDLISMVAW